MTGTESLTEQAQTQQAAAVRFNWEMDFALRPVRTVKDPLKGFEWEIREISHQPYQEYLRRGRVKSPFFQAIQVASIKGVATDALIKGRRKKKKLTKAQEAAAEARGDDPATRALDEELRKIDFAKLELADLSGGAQGVALLVANIRGLQTVRFRCNECAGLWTDPDQEGCPSCHSPSVRRDDIDAEFTPDVALQILSNPWRVTEDAVQRVFEDQEDTDEVLERQWTLGDLMSAWVLREAAETELYRRNFQARAEENLDTTSGGN